MQLFLRLDKKTYTLEVSQKDTLKSLKVKLTDKAGVPPYQLSLYFCGRELVDNKTLEQENIFKESTIEVILIQSLGDFLQLCVVSQINPSLKTYIRIEEGKKIIALKEEIYKFLHCLPEKQHLTAVNERKPEKIKYLSDMDTIWTYELDHEYKIYVYYEFEGTITFKHRISSCIYKLKIKSNSTIRQIKDKIREEIQIGTVTEIYNQNVKLSNNTSLADNRVTPADVLEIELLGDYPDRKQQQPNYTQQDISRPKQQQPNYTQQDISRPKQQQPNYTQQDISRPKQHQQHQQQQQQQQQHPQHPQQQQHSQQPQHQYQLTQLPQGPNYHNIRPQPVQQPQPIPRTEVPPQQPQSYEAQHQQQQQHRYEQRFQQHQNYEYQNEPPSPNPHDQFIDSGRFDQCRPARNPTQREVHKPSQTPVHRMSSNRDPVYDNQSPFLPIQQDNWFRGGAYNPTTDEPVYQHAAPDPRERPTYTYSQNRPVIDPDELTDAFLTQIVMAAQNEWQEIATILLNDFQKVLEIFDQKQHPFTSAMCILKEWKNRCQMHGHNPNVMPYNRNSLKFVLKAVGRQDLVLQFF